MLLQKLLMRFCIRLKCFMPSRYNNLFYFLHNCLRRLINKMLRKFPENKFRSLVIGMNHIDIIKTIIAQYIDDQFIGRKIMNPFKFIGEMMNDFYQSCFTAIVFNDAITYMT